MTTKTMSESPGAEFSGDTGREGGDQHVAASGRRLVAVTATPHGADPGDPGRKRSPRVRNDGDYVSEWDPRLT